MMSWPRLGKEARPPGAQWAGITWRILGNAGLHVRKKKVQREKRTESGKGRRLRSRRRILGCRRMP